MIADTKVCTGPCGRELPRSAYALRRKSDPRYVQSMCKECWTGWDQGPAQKKWYESHPGARREASKRWIQRTQDNVSAIKMASGCMDCGYRDHSEALQFDHVRGEKVENISRMVLSGFAWDRIVAEMEKCEVVCANCHAVRTAVRRQEDNTDGGDAI